MNKNVILPIYNGSQQQSYAQFNNICPTTMENPSSTTVGISFNVVSPGFNSDFKSKSMGLPMDNLIEKKEVTQQQEHEEAIPNTTPVIFNNLVIPGISVVEEKFAVQSIPVDFDRSMLPKPVSLVEEAINEVNVSHLNKNVVQQDPKLVNNGKKLNNWFTRLLDQKGQDYITSGRLTVDEVSRNAERILDDMIAGKIDYGKQGQYIIYPVIIETLINYCANKLAMNTAIQFALGYCYNDHTNISSINDEERLRALRMIDGTLSRNITQAITIVNQDIDIYNILYQRLSFVNNTKNASSLFSLTNDLNNYRKQIKKRY